MHIHNPINEPYSFAPELQPLFDAMQAGKRITEVVCMAGTINKDDRTKDFKLENFVATDYWVAMSMNGQTGEKNDYVDTDAPNHRKGGNPNAGFYMNWVISFKL